MLSNIRNIANGFVIRLLLAMIAFAFVGWGIKDVLQGRNNYDIVTFTHAENITENDFMKAKSDEISMLQKQSGSNLSEEDIKQLDIDRVVLQRLINDNILHYIANHYNLYLSEESVIYFVKQSPVFRNDKGEFDISIFKSIFRNSSSSENEYLQDFKEKMIKNILVSAFLEAFKTPKIMVNNIVDYMSEQRFADLVEINLKAPVDNIGDLTLEDIKEFYFSNKELFTIQEMRGFQYVKSNAETIAKKVNISKQELQDFYLNNKEEFGNDFEKAKKEILASLKQQKVDELMLEFAKNLEDDVAAGSTLKEISEKYEMQLITLKDVTYNDITKEDSNVAIAADAIFEMSEGEVLYPIEMSDKSGFLLVELSNITPPRTQEFTEVEDKAKNLLTEKLTSKINLNNFEEVLKNFKANSKSTIANLKNSNSSVVKIDSQFSITRIAAEKDDKLPQGLLVSIFQTKKGDLTPIFKSNDKAYFACVRQVKINEDKAKSYMKSAGESISTTIRNGIIEELIANFIKKNKMKINFRDKVLQ